MKIHRVQSEICICNASGSTTVKKDTKMTFRANFAMGKIMSLKKEMGNLYTLAH